MRNGDWDWHGHRMDFRTSEVDHMVIIVVVKIKVWRDPWWTAD